MGAQFGKPEAGEAKWSSARRTKHAAIDIKHVTERENMCRNKGERQSKLKRGCISTNGTLLRHMFSLCDMFNVDGCMFGAARRRPGRLTRLLSRASDVPHRPVMTIADVMVCSVNFSVRLVSCFDGVTSSPTCAVDTG